jgi:hypothetical protein
MTKIEGSGSESGSISQRHGSADPDPDPPQNVMDPQHCSQLGSGFKPRSGSRPCYGIAQFFKKIFDIQNLAFLVRSSITQKPVLRIRILDPNDPYVFGPPGSRSFNDLIRDMDPDPSLIKQKL